MVFIANDKEIKTLLAADERRYTPIKPNLVITDLE